MLCFPSHPSLGGAGGGHTLRIQVSYVSALGAYGKVDDTVDERGFLRGERIGERITQFTVCGGIVSHATKGLYHLIVASTRGECRGRRIGATTKVGVIAAVDATIIEDDNRHRKLVATDGLNLHSAKAKGAVALNGKDLLATGDSGCNGIAHADAHDTIVVFNNGGIYRGNDPNLSGGPDPSPTSLTPGARYDKMIEAFGGVAYHATTTGELRNALTAALASRKPSLINCVIDPAVGTESGHIGNLNPKSVASPSPSQGGVTGGQNPLKANTNS